LRPFADGTTMRRFRIATALSACMLWLIPLQAWATTSSEVADEARFVELINDERAAVGLDPLELLGDLTFGARAQAEAQADVAEGPFHNPDLASITTGWAVLGENVGVGYSVETLHRAFMESDAHRENVLAPIFDHIGAGVVERNGMLWVSIVFADMIGVPSSGTIEAQEAPVDGNGAFWDDDGSVHEVAIETLAEAGITRGCGDHLYCPDEAVTRGEMAAFLQRALGLEPVVSDVFSDDDGSPFEPAIDALAGAGITQGCGGDNFCPDEPVTRGQMAAFLQRALGLEPVVSDVFSDDDGSPFEPAIDALARAGITRGCATSRFCPDDLVTRGQMASFLVRAFEL
jgi:hypothetical protein